MNDAQKKQTISLLTNLRDLADKNDDSASGYHLGLGILSLIALVGGIAVIVNAAMLDSREWLFGVVLGAAGLIGLLCALDDTYGVNDKCSHQDPISAEELQLRILKLGLEELQSVTDEPKAEQVAPAQSQKTSSLKAKPEKGEALNEEKTWPDSELENVDMAQQDSDGPVPY